MTDTDDKVKALAQEILHKVIIDWEPEAQRIGAQIIQSPQGEMLIQYPVGPNRFPGTISFTYNPAKAVEELIIDCKTEFDNFTVDRVRLPRIITDPRAREDLIYNMIFQATRLLLTGVWYSVNTALGMSFEICREIAVGTLASGITQEGDLDGYQPVNMQKRTADLSSAAGERVKTQILQLLEQLPNIQFRHRSGPRQQITWGKIIAAFRKLGLDNFTQDNVAQEIRIGDKRESVGVTGLQRWLARERESRPELEDWEALKRFLSTRMKDNLIDS